MSEPISEPRHDVVPEKALMRKKMGLGRGLDALLGESIREPVAIPLTEGVDSVAGATPSANTGVGSIAVADIHPNPAQPRRYFAEEALAELAQSLIRHGVVQPIVVRPHAGGYQIVAGERRWRAAQRAQLHVIPAIVRDFSDKETLKLR
jgi:ParB family transcriptional regulator, chromosome partitioning protein